MLENVQLLRNLGQFDSASCNQPLTRLTLIHAENGRGKTTLAAVLRSMASGDAGMLAERKRLGSNSGPHAVITVQGASPAVFQNGSWSNPANNLVIFDDSFVDENFHSGLVVEAGHRQRLHELIIGAQGIALNNSLSQLVQQIETHNANLRTKANAIPAAVRGGLSVDDFCALQIRPNIDGEIDETKRARAAAAEQAAIASAELLEEISLSPLDPGSLSSLLGRELEDLDAQAVTAVEAHVERLGENGETWLAEGVQHEEHINGGTCPYCQRDASELPILQSYRAYFGEAYTSLKQDVSNQLNAISQTHGGQAAANFERHIRVLGERLAFWQRFAEINLTVPDTQAIVHDWTAAYEGAQAALKAKLRAPLDAQVLNAGTASALEQYATHRQSMQALNEAVATANETIELVKERAQAANVADLDANLARLEATKARHESGNSALCQSYLDEVAAKAQTQQQRDQAKVALDTHRQTVFPAYETAINVYLQRFNAGFRLGSVKGENRRTGAVCTYNVLINNTPVAVATKTGSADKPSFRTALSAVDRNTLALAFFFACLDQDPGLSTRVVVIDDPITSLDEHRTMATAQEIRRLAGQAEQVIVLSHDKPFLCRVWGNADRTYRSALRIVRNQTGSVIEHWDPRNDSITEYDRRHQTLR